MADQQNNGGGNTQLTLLQRQRKEIGNALMMYQPTIMKLVGSDDKAAGRFMSSFMAMAGKVDMSKGTTDSFVLSCVNAAAAGYDPMLQECAIVPYKGKFQMQPQYQGVIKTAINTGLVRKVDAYPVYKGDFIAIELGDNPSITHKPSLAAVRDKENLELVYCVVHLATGEKKFDFMNIAEIEKIRKNAPGGDSEAWTKANTNNYVEMARKTVVKRTLKLVPKSYELQRVLNYDDELETSGRQTNLAKKTLDLGDAPILPTPPADDDDDPTPEQATAKPSTASRGSEKLNEATKKTRQQPKHQPEPVATEGEIVQKGEEKDLPEECSSPKCKRMIPPGAFAVPVDGGKCCSVECADVFEEAQAAG